MSNGISSAVRSVSRRASYAMVKPSSRSKPQHARAIHAMTSRLHRRGLFHLRLCRMLWRWLGLGELCLELLRHEREREKHDRCNIAASARDRACRPSALRWRAAARGIDDAMLLALNARYASVVFAGGLRLLVALVCDKASPSSVPKVSSARRPLYVLGYSLSQGSPANAFLY